MLPRFVSLLLVLTPLLLTCKPLSPTQRQREESRARLIQHMEEDRRLRNRLRSLGTSAEVRQGLGPPTKTSPCGANDRQCWYYEISHSRLFVCFDQAGKVTCNGTFAVSP